MSSNYYIKQILAILVLLQIASLASSTTTTEAQFYGCHDWSEFSECEGENCSEEGTRTRSRMCNYGVEWIEYLEFKKCSTECRTTKKTTTTTTTQAPVTTPEIFHMPVNCSRCDFSHGQNWLPDVANCHKYYICVPLTNNRFRIFKRDCGDLFWDQDAVTCVRTPARGCQMATASPKLTTKKQAETQATTDSHSSVTHKPGKPCKSDPMLHFSFDNDFNDVSCTRATSVRYGEGSNIVKNGNKAYACFSGDSHLEVPYMRKWFAGRQVNHFSVTLWYKSDTVKKVKHVGIVHNGDCKDKAGFELGMRSSQSSLYSSVTTDKQFMGANVDSVIGKWQFAAWVYNGSNLKLYINGKLKDTTSATGFLSNTDAPLTIGKLCKSCYFTGCLDDLKLFSRSLAPKELKRMSLVQPNSEE